MAEGGYEPSCRRPKIQQVCRYFIHGACNRGDNCNFVHDRTGTVPANNVCRFYQMGQCSYGDRCRFDHIKAKPSQPVNPAEPSPCSNSTRHTRIFKPSAQQSQGRRQNEADWKPAMSTLKKGGAKDDVAAAKKPSSSGGARRKHYEKNWVKAKDFIPGQKFHAGASYAKAAHLSDEEDCGRAVSDPSSLPRDPKEEDLLCPYFAHGECPYQERCVYIHGDVCDICQFPRLHPTNKTQREQHQKECQEEMEKDMEHSFAVHDSKDKECNICLELVLEKAEKDGKGATNSQSSSDQLFGILENCAHCFCLSCIRRWRSDKSFGKNVRMCPICRVHSDFVTPSNVWVEDEEKKKRVIQDYKDRLSVKPCQYFKQGKGECPFNEKCFYKHAYPDGTIATPKPRKRRRRVDAEGEMSLIEAISLWDFLEIREDGLISLEDELSLHLLGLLHDSDFDDDSDGLFGYSSDTDTDPEFYF